MSAAEIGRKPIDPSLEGTELLETPATLLPPDPAKSQNNHRPCNMINFRPRFRRRAGALMAALLCAGLLPLPAQTISKPVPAPVGPIHVRVLFESNPAREAVVAWTTMTEGRLHRLYIDTEPRGGDLRRYSRSLPSTHSQAYTLREEEVEAGITGFTHNVFLGNLEPATRYYLTAVSDDKSSKEYYFVTAPDDDREIRLLAVGDNRVGEARSHPDNMRRRVNALMGRLFEKHPDIVGMAHGGDYTHRAHWSQLYFHLNDHVDNTTTSDNRLLPIIPARGNHDLDVGYAEVFWWPNREHDHYYTTQLSSQVAFITLNTTISRSGDQQVWLESQLQTLRPRNRWVVAQYHHPAYPSGRDFASGAGTREAWVPLFEEYHVDLVYEAHDHLLKRTYPIYQEAVDTQRGIVYIGDGGGGVSLRQPPTDRWYLEVVGRHFHAHLLTFGKDRLTGVAIDPTDTVVDAFEFTHDRRGTALSRTDAASEIDRRLELAGAGAGRE
jgi:acid phosphatase type 7